MSMITGSNIIWRLLIYKAFCCGAYNRRMVPGLNLIWRPLIYKAFCCGAYKNEWFLVGILFDDLLYNFKFRLSGSVPFYLAIKKKHGKAWTGFKIFHVWTEKREQSLTEKSFAAGSRTCAAVNPWSHAWGAWSLSGIFVRVLNFYLSKTRKSALWIALICLSENPFSFNWFFSF